MELEQIALKDEYFIEKKLYPNVDFYSGITLKAMGFPTDMFTVLFARGAHRRLDRAVERDDRGSRRRRSAVRASSTPARPSATTCGQPARLRRDLSRDKTDGGGREAALLVCGGARAPAPLPPALRLGGDPRLPGQARDPGRRNGRSRRRDLRADGQRRGPARLPDGGARRRLPARGAPRHRGRRRPDGCRTPGARLFDCDADPTAIAACLARDPVLAPLVAARPGLRLPGAWDPFETGCRAILGQQVSVAAAIGLARDARGGLRDAAGGAGRRVDPRLPGTGGAGRGGCCARAQHAARPRGGDPGARGGGARRPGPVRSGGDAGGCRPALHGRSAGSDPGRRSTLPCGCSSCRTPCRSAMSACCGRWRPAPDARARRRCSPGPRRGARIGPTRRSISGRRTRRS